MVAAIASVVGIFVLSGGAGGSAGAAVAGVRPVLGDATASVVIVEYGDFQCPSCGAFARTVEPQLRAAYIDPGLARLEWHDFAWIGPESREAANAARCAGDHGRFWEYHDRLYQSQAGENQGAFSRDRLKAMAIDLGLEPEAFGACVDSGRYAGAVQADFQAVRSLGLNGTPTFFIGSQRIVGAQPFEVFAQVLDAQLGR
ncbi:MAG: thioredoxin domain-containing protein [Chloroflexota bacterium]